VGVILPHQIIGCDVMIAISIKNASRIYEKDHIKITALKNVSQEFELGKIYVITGNSGSGKSTLIQNLGLLDNLTSGEITIKGKNVSTLAEDEKANIRKNKIGFVFQSYYLNPYMKSYENVMLPLYLDKELSNSKRKKIALSLLEKVGLKDRANHLPSELSGGEQQRVALARALANNPSIILADEPTGNLDKENEKKILEIFELLKKQDKCIIIVSHNSEVTKYADYVLEMKQGTLGVKYENK